MSSTQEQSPISTLIEDLGIETPTNDDVSTEEDLNLSDSEENTDESTQSDDNASEANEEENTSDDDTETSKVLERLSELEKQQEIANKRLTDKDKYINELKQQLDNMNKSTEDDTEETTEDFWDNPEGKFAEVQQQLRVANLRIDEQAYASNKPDYYELVNANKLKEEFALNNDFMVEFNQSDRPYETAYNYLKTKQEQTTTTKEQEKIALEAEIEKKVMAKYGLDKKAKETPPSINNMGGKSSNKKELPEDGFSSVFGTGF